MANEVLTWRVAEDIKPKRRFDWYASISVIALSLAALFFFLGNTLFGIFLILALIIVIVLSRTNDDEYSVSLTIQGVIVGKTLYPYQTLSSFSLREEGEEHTLVLESQKIFVPFITLPIHKEHTDVIRELLSQQLPETHLEGGLFEKITDYLRL